MEQHRLFEEKVEVESKVIDLTKESTSKDEMLENLQKKLLEREMADAKLKKEMEDLEEQLQCSICAELFIEPKVLNCGHMFCKNCIEEWKVKKKTCPICRTKITSTVSVYHVDRIIEKNVDMLPLEARERRLAIINDRQKGPCKLPAKKRKHSHRMNAGTSTSTGTAVPQQQRLVRPAVLTAPHFPTNQLRDAALTIHLHRSPNVSTDPFAWQAPEIQLPTVLDDNWMGPQHPPVPVAAIDLTNSPHNPILTARRRGRTSTSTSALNTTVDLTYL